MQHRVLLIGTFLSKSGASRSVIEDLADRLRTLGCTTICASTYRNRWKRSLHMLWTACRTRRSYDLAIVDLYSGSAFLWGEAMSVILCLLRRPFILVLHGGAFLFGKPANALNKGEKVSLQS